MLFRATVQKNVTAIKESLYAMPRESDFNGRYMRVHFHKTKISFPELGRGAIRRIQAIRSYILLTCSRKCAGP